MPENAGTLLPRVLPYNIIKTLNMTLKVNGKTAPNVAYFSPEKSRRKFEFAIYVMLKPNNNTAPSKRFINLKERADACLNTAQLTTERNKIVKILGYPTVVCLLPFYSYFHLLLLTSITQRNIIYTITT